MGMRPIYQTGGAWVNKDSFQLRPSARFDKKPFASANIGAPLMGSEGPSSAIFSCDYADCGFAQRPVIVEYFVIQFPSIGTKASNYIYIVKGVTVSGYISPSVRLGSRESSYQHRQLGSPLP